MSRRTRHSRRLVRRPGRRPSLAPRCATTGQAAFRSWAAADDYRARHEARRVYTCPDCGWLHLTDLTAPQADSIRSRNLPPRTPVVTHDPTTPETPVEHPANPWAPLPGAETFPALDQTRREAAA